MAERLAADLANIGLVIVSGLARGIDTAAHRGTLQANGKTVAILGTGVDVIYRVRTKRLATPSSLRAARLRVSFRSARSPPRKTFPFAIASSAG
jgi:DNA processing protein